MSACIYIEGGGDSKELQIRCRAGFRKLLERCGLSGRMPRLVPCGGRNAAFDDFSHAHDSASERDYVALWVDSEDPMADIEKAWEHLEARDGWDAPIGSRDNQVLLMVTCMETWISTDRHTLRKHYGAHLQHAALPALTNMESRDRHAIQDALIHANPELDRPESGGESSSAGAVPPAEGCTGAVCRRSGGGESAGGRGGAGMVGESMTWH